jgi:hypothetical protein
LVVWVLDVAALAAGPGAAALVQRLLRLLHGLRMHPTAPLRQVAYLRGTEGRQAQALVALLRGVGVEPRLSDRTEILVEVERPEGVILTGLMGRPYEPPGAADDYCRRVNEEKDRAQGCDDRERLARIAEDERDELKRRLVPEDDEPQAAAVARAPRLSRILLADADGAARQLLLDELTVREVPLAIIVDPASRGVRLSNWPGVGSALAVFPDRTSLLQAARDLAMPDGSFAVGEMPPRKLFEWATSQKWTVALNVYRDPKTPLYVVLDPTTVAALGRGETPAG